ncbi:MAG: magnesium transporter CorA family protein [Anaerolineales bacterium]|nr:magnesium transporter CorA family protein [Anaerolineales bacterium]
MITIYHKQASQDAIETRAEVCEGSWVHVVEPTPAELDHLRGLGLPPDFLTHLADPDERARAERDDGTTLIVLRFPFAQGADADLPYVTIPLTIIITGSVLVTISPQSTGFLQKFAAGHVRGLSTVKKTRFVLHMLWHIANAYLAQVREINTAVDALEDRLQRSLRNQEVLGLLRYQKSLVYFTTALKSNELVLERLQKGRLLQMFEEDAELLEDVLIEVRQAIEMTEISENILSQMMDAFASIISNNLNVVMKVLTSVTIVISLPSLVASLYGMNVPLPGAEHPLAFLGVLGAAVAVSALVAFVFWRKDWL